MAKSKTSEDAQTHRAAVALYEAVVELVPEGGDRVDMTLDDLVRSARLGRRFSTNGSASRAWRYLRSIGAVQAVGRNGKVPVAHPDDLVGATTPASGGGGRGRGRGAAKRRSSTPPASAAARPKGPAAGSAGVLANAVETFTGQVQRSLQHIAELRAEIGVLDRQMGDLESQHNRMVNELVEFRDGLRDANLASFFDTLVADELWVYEERPDTAAH
jgi:hypothetical protein